MANRTTFPDGSTLKRYDLPSINGLEGWATIVLGADGFFAAVTDYGNYAYRWCATGEVDFRNFILRIGGDYLLGKVSSEDVYDDEATERLIKKHILEHRKEGWYSKERARKEWDHLVACGVADNGEIGFHQWYEGTEIGDAYEMRVDVYPRDASAFAEKTLPRLKDAIRAELAAEKVAA